LKLKAFVDAAKRAAAEVAAAAGPEPGQARGPYDWAEDD
jgi:hypothetical protein